jgi:hypothetical protein
MSAAQKQDEAAAAKLKIGPGRISFPFIFTPRQTARGDRHELTLLLPPTYDTSFITQACVEKCIATWGPNRAKWPPNARKPEQVVRKCEEKLHLAGYEKGWHFVKAVSESAPGIVGFDPKEAVTDPKQGYAGRWAKMSCRPFIYTMREGIGVSLGLSNVQLLKHDATFGRTKPDQDFDVEAEEMEDY